MSSKRQQLAAELSAQSEVIDGLAERAAAQVARDTQDLLAQPESRDLDYWVAVLSDLEFDEQQMMEILSMTVGDFCAIPVEGRGLGWLSKLAALLTTARQQAQTQLLRQLLAASEGRGAALTELAAALGNEELRQLGRQGWMTNASIN